MRPCGGNPNRFGLLVFANLADIRRETVVRRLELAVFLQEVDQFLCRQVLCAARVETFLHTELFDDGLQ